MSRGAVKRAAVLHAGSLTKMKLSPKGKEGKGWKQCASAGASFLKKRTGAHHSRPGLGEGGGLVV
ncbi:hypothetical protein CK911_05760 [Aeromonas sp. CU5]|nr:hypothetical protein CK911_05760 [Aeromonas sp. CU5]